MTTETDPSRMTFGNQIVFSITVRRFYYYNESVDCSIFDGNLGFRFLLLVFILQDIAQRIQFTLPGYLSSGGTPCSFDVLSEAELHHIGKGSSRIGFPGTMRCYLERIRRSHHYP